MQIRSLNTIGCHGYGDMVFLVSSAWPRGHSNTTTKLRFVFFFLAVDLTSLAFLAVILAMFSIRCWVISYPTAPCCQSYEHVFNLARFF